MRLLVMVVVVFAVFPLVYWLLTKINSRVASEADEGSLPGQVAKAAPDGYTLLAGASTTLTLNPANSQQPAL